MRNRRSRRTFLKALGASAAMAPVIPLLSREAEATDTMPKRLVLVFFPVGSHPPSWVPSEVGPDFTLGPALEPLAPVRDDIIVISNLRHAFDGEAGNQHTHTMCSLWTGGSQIDSGSTAPSIDQVLASEHGDTTPFRSLVLGTLTEDTNRGRMSHAGPSAPIPPDTDPIALYDRLFAGLSETGPDPRTLRRRSVLDLLREDVSSIRRRVGVSDQHKLDAHLEAIRAIETRNDASRAACTPAGFLEDGGERITGIPARSRSMIDQTVAALSCDLTRFVGLQYGHGGYDKKYPWLGSMPSNHHGLTHVGPDRGVSREDAHDWLTRIHAWHAGEVAYLIERLRSVPEGDGTLLDHTLVVMAGEMRGGAYGERAHEEIHTPFLVAGGGLSTGRHLDAGGEDHHRLLVSILRYFGDSRDSFGPNDAGSGPLAGLL